MRLSFVYLLIVGSLNVPIKRFPSDFKQPYVTFSTVNLRHETVNEGVLAKISNLKTSVTFTLNRNMNFVLSLK